MSLLTGKIIPCRKVITIPITQEFIAILEALANKDGIKYPLKFKDCKEGKICEDDDKNESTNDPIKLSDDEYE